MPPRTKVPHSKSVTRRIRWRNLLHRAQACAVHDDFPYGDIGWVSGGSDGTSQLPSLNLILSKPEQRQEKKDLRTANGKAFNMMRKTSKRGTDKVGDVRERSPQSQQFVEDKTCGPFHFAFDERYRRKQQNHDFNAKLFSHKAGRHRTQQRTLDRDLKAELLLPGIYRPLRKAILVPPWVFVQQRLLRSPPPPPGLSVLYGPPRLPLPPLQVPARPTAATPPRALAPTAVVPTSTLPTAEVLSPPADAKTPSPAAATKVEPIAAGLGDTRRLPDGGGTSAALPNLSEEDAAELSRLAADEAASCILPNGCINARRLRTVMLASQPRLARMVLSRLPSHWLRECASGSGVALGASLPANLFQALITGDVINSALLAEHRRCCAAWLHRSLPAEDKPTPPIGAELRVAKPIFDAAGMAAASITPCELDCDERQHPAVEAVRAGGRLCVVPSMATFQVLLSAFTHGLSEYIPWEDGVKLGGSACLASLTLPADLMNKYRPQLEKAADLYSSVGLVHRVLVRALGHGPGSESASALILRFAGPRVESQRVLSPIAQDLFGESSPYANSDIDLFVVACSKIAATKALEASRQTIATAMLKASGEPPVCVRTPNSVTLCGKYPLRHVQLVLRIAEETSEIVAFADLHCTGLCYDGRVLWGTPCAIRSLETGYSFMSNHQICGRKENLQRIAKYAQRGVGTLIYELCRHDPRCDVLISEQVRKQMDIARALARKPCGIRWRARGPSAVFMAVDGYDEIHLPRGSPTDVVAFVQSLAESAATVPQIEVVDPSGSEEWWLPLVAWRRERAPQLKRKIGLELREEAKRCYACGCNCVSQVEKETLDDHGEGIDSLGGGVSGPQQERVPLCRECTTCNEERRVDDENLGGFTAVVTGGRCKLGYEACLMLLRRGAFVVACTRFPRCAAKRFLMELDSATWASRVHIYGVDFSEFSSLQGFAAQLVQHYSVDILVNNAAQTVKRPPAYYKSLLVEECDAPFDLSVLRKVGTDPWASARSTRTFSDAVLNICSSIPSVIGPSSAHESIAAVGLPDRAVNTSRLGLGGAAITAQQTAACADLNDAAGVFFPPNRRDLHGEQLDLRPHTSWTATLLGQCTDTRVSTRELLEVLAVNSVAPFVLLQELATVLTRPGGDRGRFVVNVTSAEGVFDAEGAAAKGPEHPHTNMAKAAMNMLTKTAAQELGPQGVFCVAVDPGWVSQMRPGEPTAPGRPLPPLSEADGAARIVAPILDGVRALRTGRAPMHRVMLRNFRPVPW